MFSSSPSDSPSPVYQLPRWLAGSLGVVCVYHMPFTVGTAMTTNSKMEIPMRPISINGLPWPCLGSGRVSFGRSRNRKTTYK